MIPYGRQTIEEDDIEEVVKVLKSDFLTTGPKVAEFGGSAQSMSARNMRSPFQTIRRHCMRHAMRRESDRGMR